MIVFSACFISVVHGYNQELKHSCSFNTANRQNDFIEVLEKRLVLLQNLNIPKDSNNDEFIRHLLENKDYKNFCQEENGKEAQKIYQRMLTKANHPEEIRRIQNYFSNVFQKKENQFPLLFMKYFIAKNLDAKIDVNKRKKTYLCEYCKKSVSSSNYLKMHMNSVHNGIKDHKCDSCGKSFLQAG